ncbi:hypothetical protein Nepgr_010785 [Nepenthes gracilis]|uniref:Glycosyltransferase n=1 Tax=Nepenthes gracilis TaxID=150966 RepID=A0AAD3SCY6_NEPGR|nr:hypothetical protein Nepgr_010785 [Nepenthes gracilis]
MERIVMYPSMGISHLMPMMELAKLLHNHQPSSLITILVTPHPNSALITSYLAQISTSKPFVTFHYLPNPSLSSPPSSVNSPSLSFDRARINNPNLKQALEHISRTSTIKVFVIDFFNTAAHEIAVDFRIPTFYYFPVSACALAATLYFPTIDKTTVKSIKDMDTDFEIPSLPPVPSDHMPMSMHDRNSQIYKNMLNLATQMPKAEGIIINTFEFLEGRTIKAISEGLCVPDGRTPPIFSIGPLIGEKEDNESVNDGGARHECLSWLDSQPSRSVLFLCFGSMGVFSAAQLREMAVGLEKSGHRFLWVARTPPPGDKNGGTKASLESIMPEGFLERTKDRGLLWGSWAPQLEVLSHDSVGGFVTHCGWNSVLEAVWHGVPLIAWPLFAEQRLNKVFLVEAAKLALPLNLAKDGFVTADELEVRVRDLMGSKSGRPIRERVMAAREEAKAAIGQGGSSRAALDKLYQLWKCEEGF